MRALRRLLCQLGHHRYTAWEESHRYNTLLDNPIVWECRVCVRCLSEERRCRADNLKTSAVYRARRAQVERFLESKGTRE